MISVMEKPSRVSYFYCVILDCRISDVSCVNMCVILTKMKNTLGCWVPTTEQKMLEFTTLLWSLLWSQASNPSMPLSQSCLLLHSVNTGMKQSLHGVRMAAGWVIKCIHLPWLNKCNLDTKFNRKVFCFFTGRASYHTFSHPVPL